MSGPSLRQPTGHRQIHGAAFHEVEEALRAAEHAMSQPGDPAVFGEVAEVFLEVVEARILVHAAEEEDDLYPEWVAEHPPLTEEVEQLMQEHRGLHRALSRVEDRLRAKDPEGTLAAMRAVVGQAAAHARHEERVLDYVRGVSSA